MAGERVAPRKVVSFTYEIWDQDGVLREKAELPMSYLHGGRGDIFTQIEHALEGCVIGDRVEVTLSPEEGFGPRRPELTFTDDLANTPPEVRYVGAEVEMQSDRGETRTFVVSHIGEGTLTVDGNHPLAGETLTFKVTVTDIRDATGDEVIRGAPAEGPLSVH